MVHADSLTASPVCSSDFHRHSNLVAEDLLEPLNERAAETVVDGVDLAVVRYKVQCEFVEIVVVAVDNLGGPIVLEFIDRRLDAEQLEKAADPLDVPLPAFVAANCICDVLRGMAELLFLDALLSLLSGAEVVAALGAEHGVARQVEVA